jgi:heat shock protein HslJ
MRRCGAGAVRVGVFGCALLALVTGCSSGSSSVVRTQAQTQQSTSTPSTTVSSSAGSSSPGAQPSISVRPSRALTDRQKVRVSGSGFTPNEALQVIECAQKGLATGPGDCNLTGMLSATSDESGRVSAVLVVLRGPFGSNNIVCSKSQQCLISVTQASLSPTEEADAVIEFAPTSS